MQRSNARAARDTILWLGLIIGLAVVIVLTWFSWYSVPLLVVYGALYGGAADSRWHEMGHGTAFRWQPANTVIYHLASFMLWRGAHHLALVALPPSHPTRSSSDATPRSSSRDPRACVDCRCSTRTLSAARRC